MKLNLAQKIIAAHVTDSTGKPLKAGEKALIRIDQTLTQDSTGTMAWLQFEAMGVPRVRTDLSVSYVDHNMLQIDYCNPDDHRYLRTVAARYGALFSPPGTGICHQLHLENFAKPGSTLLGSDSHTPTSGGVGALAMGAGGLSVAMAMAGKPYPLSVPKVVRVWLSGQLRGFATAKDVILHLLGQLTVKGGLGKIFEYAGPGLATLSVPERACIANMGAELGATTSLFPSDNVTRDYLSAMARPEDWVHLEADPDAKYDETISIELGQIEPLAAQPHLPDRVVPVAALDGLRVDQVVVGSCTNSSYTELHAVAELLRGRRIAEHCDFMLAPGSKQVLRMLSAEGSLDVLLAAGVRILECSCGPCIGAGGAPCTNGVSVRTTNRNFEGRSGTKSAQVYLVSPLTAALAGLRGRFTDPAGWGTPPRLAELPQNPPSIRHLFLQPAADGATVEVLRGPNIAPLAPFPAPAVVVAARMVLKAGDQITTDHIMPANAEINKLRSNLPAISEYTFCRMDAEFVSRARAAGCGVIVAGENYGQGSSREQAAMAPRFLHVQAIVAKSIARIHRDNLVNCGVFPFLFADRADYERLTPGQLICFAAEEVRAGRPLTLHVDGLGDIEVRHDLTAAEIACILDGGLLSQVRGAAGAKGVAAV